MNNTDEIHKILAAAERHCYAAKNRTLHNTGRYCELIFDGIMCWPTTGAGILAEQPCSGEPLKATGQGLATRQCGDNGRWYVPENSSISWTNYSQCGTFYIEKIIPAQIYSLWIPIIKYITRFGYAISLTSLIIALIIFMNIKRLHCARNKLHINLFVSFVMRASMSLLKDMMFVRGTALSHDTVFVDGQPNFLKENYSWVCKAIMSLIHYFIIANYMFLLMEGTYLYNLMFTNLFTDNGVMIYCISGWVLPLLFVVPWVVMKIVYEDIFCWTQKENNFVSLLIEIPIGTCVIINFLLFIIIIRVLSGKLTSMYIQQRKIKYWKLLRSILILVPLFGIPYSLSLSLSFFVTKSLTLEVLWLFFDQTFTAFQGLFTSLVYFFLNSEVQTELKRKYNSFKERNQRECKRNRTISNTQQTSMPLNEELQEIQQYFGKKERLLKADDFF